MMNEILYMTVALLAGLALGIFFFGGLWFTVRKVINTKTPAIWFFASYFLRVSITLIGIYYVSSGNWQRLLICLLGFILARIIVTRITNASEVKQKKEVHHEA